MVKFQFYKEKETNLVGLYVAEEEQAELNRQEYLKIKYRDDRRINYPDIGDQLDALYHAGVFPKEMADKIKAVKDANPKPT